jgi:hypothetical protein
MFALSIAAHPLDEFFQSRFHPGFATLKRTMDINPTEEDF